MEKQKNPRLSALQESVHFSQGDQTFRSVAVIKRILYVTLIVGATYVSTSLYSRHVGSVWQNGIPFKKIQKQLGRFLDENKRQAVEIKDLRNKMGYKNETILVYRGIVQNKPEWLELSRVEHQSRSKPFEFVNWYFPDEAVEVMFKLEAWDCLEWVMRQPNWYSCINETTYSKMIKFNEDLNALNLKKAAQLK